MMFPQFGSLKSMAGQMPPSVHPAWGISPPQFNIGGGQVPAVHPAWGINAPQFHIGEGGFQGPPAIHPAWGNQPPIWGSGAANLQNHLASLRQMNNPQFQMHPAMFQHIMSPQYY